MQKQNIINKTTIILICIIVAISFFIAGYMAGVKSAVSFGSKALIKLIEMKKIDIDIDETMLANGIMQYKNNIGGCLFLDNETNGRVH